MSNMGIDRNIECKLRVNKTNIYYFLLCALIIKPDFFNQIPILTKIYSITNYMITAYALYKIMVSKFKIINKCGLILLIYLWLLIVTILNEGSLNAYIQASLLPILAIIISYYGMVKNEYRFLQSFLLLLMVYVAINFITIILLPEGLPISTSVYANGANENYYFLGQKNTNIRILILCSFISAIFDAQYRQSISIRTKVVVIIMILSGILIKSMTTIVASIVPLVFIVLLDVRKIPKFISVKTGMLIQGLFLIFVVIFQKLEIFSYLIERIMKKSLSLTGRTGIWKNGVEILRKSLLFGNGIDTKANVAMEIGTNNDSLHNFIMDYLYQGGIIVIILWILSLLILSKYINSIYDNKSKNVCNLFVFSYMIIWLTEPSTRARILSFMIIYSIIMVLSYNKKYATGE